MTWSDWPVVRQPAKSLGAAAIIAAMVVTIAGWDAWLAVLAGVVLVLATAEALLPTRYSVGPNGVEIRRAFSREAEPWSRFERARPVREGFVLVGRGSRPALKRHRTRVLRCPEVREEVQEVLCEHLEVQGAHRCER